MGDVRDMVRAAQAALALYDRYSFLQTLARRSLLRSRQQAYRAQFGFAVWLSGGECFQTFDWSARPPVANAQPS
jgi:hypothetical protein